MLAEAHISSLGYLWYITEIFNEGLRNGSNKVITPVHQIQDLLEVHIRCTSYHASSQISTFYELKLVSAKWHLSFSAQKTEFACSWSHSIIGFGTGVN